MLLIFRRLRAIHATSPQSNFLLITSLLLFFWTLFEGSVSYIVPIIIEHHHFSNTVLGLIIGSSSLFGAIFDILLAKYLPQTHFRRIYLFMLLTSFLLIFVLASANTIWFFLLAMALWGLAYDLMNFGTFDFISRKITREEQAGSFGHINIYKAISYTLAPLIIGTILAKYMPYLAFYAMFLFVSLATIVYFILTMYSRKSHYEYIATEKPAHRNMFKELHVLKKITKPLAIFLVLLTGVYTFDNFFWTLGPIMSDAFPQAAQYNGLFLFMYTLPALIAGWLIGIISKKYNKKFVALFTYLLACICLSTFFLFSHFLNLIMIVFCTSFFLNLSLPAIESVIAEFINREEYVEKEIEAMEDFAINIGYMIGPVIAGFTSDIFGIKNAFSILGMCSFIVIFSLSIILFLKRKRNFKIRM